MIRRIATAMLAVAGTAVVLSPPAVAAPSTGGRYVAYSAQRRVVDRTIAAGHHVRVRVPGLSSGTVVGTLTAYSPSASGSLVAYGAHRPDTTNLLFSKGVTSSNTVVVPLSHGRFTIADRAHSGHVRVAFDVTGYYRAGHASSDPGTFHGVAARRVLHPHTLRHGHVLTVKLAGKAGISASSTGAVAFTVHVLSPTRSGSLLAWSEDTPRPEIATLHFHHGRSTSGFAVVPLGAGTGVRLYATAGTVRVAVDVAGYYSYGTAASAGQYEPLPSATRLLHRTVRGTVNLAVAGHGGVPRAHVAAAVLVVHASGSRGGAVRAWRAGTSRPSRPRVLSYAAGTTTATTVAVPLSAAGHVDLRVVSSRAASLAVDVVGYVPADTITAPATYVGRYVRNLTGSDDAAIMRAEGAQDAAAGSKLVLLDVGAQLNDGTGVLLSATKIELTYADLVTALDAYLDGYSAAGGTGTVAIATNNDADFSHYTGTQRGRDWADKVIDALTSHAGVDVAAAADIEAGFVSTRAQAQAWEDGYLAATARRLYYIGDAADCPITFGATGASCKYRWTEAQYYHLAHNGTRILALPQIYNPSDAVKWANIDATGGGKIDFAGALTERAAAPKLSQHPAQGWAALYRALSWRHTAPRLPISVDLQIDD